ncbi:SDR family NAD(P)-dependent oxidoreductase [Nocardia sp. NRRL S-836]|uniref:SDR family NAD(P)-dependent oxidoreductase n=1 Tax=Nocardia sp. NRRL S-836 TaxID=1519492 RepID=UPI0009E962CE|nr:SDR family NAD(P)-dependent oxidoreductase [Nocardia sp. NRRL S-836]
MRVLITGGATGFGRVLAEELCRAGAAVVITGPDSAALRQVRGELLAVAAVTVDCTDPASVEAAVAAAEAAFGPLDVLVNNVGVTGAAWEIGQDDWWRAVEVDLRGTALTTAAVLRRMVPRKRGRIVNVVSHRGEDGSYHATASSVSAAAVVKLTEGLAAEHRGHGVTVLSCAAGRGTPAAEAASVLRRVVEGAADHRSGEHLTVEDPLVRTTWEPMPLSW